ncbi:MAG: VCBS repeat-containing protein [Gammaproteobacteria bacterium]|nr:VCBS repeat-containing protein [Gammaproteobacteria bacterium]
MLAAAFGLGGCGGSSTQDDWLRATADSGAPASEKTSRETAGEFTKAENPIQGARATSAAPQIVNPAEELQEFAPNGILRWTQATGAVDYEVWAYSDPGLTQMVEFSSALLSRQYQFTKLAGGQTYYVKLYYRVAGVWQLLPPFTIKTTSTVLKSRLSNPQEELEGFGATGTLRWTAVPGAEVYELWIYRDAALLAFAENSGPVSITQFQTKTLKPGQTYYVQVYAKVNGVYRAGGALAVTVAEVLDRTRIINPQEELDAFATNGILRWTAVTGATEYEVWIFLDPNVAKYYENSGPVAQRTYQTRTLQPNSTYYVQVFAKVDGQLKAGSPYKITTAGQPTKARLTNPQEEIEAFSTSGTLRWTEVPGADGYQLWIYGNAGQGGIIEWGESSDRTYQLKHSCGGAIYYLQVYAHVNGQWTTGWPTRLDVTQGASPADCVPPAPEVKLTSNVDQVVSGEYVTLTWSTKFATSCRASDAWSGDKALSGQESIGPLTKQSLFTLTCSGPNGSSYLAQALVTVQPPPFRYQALGSAQVLPQTTQCSVPYVAVADFTADGALDFVLGATPTTAYTAVSSPVPVTVWAGQPDGSVLDATAAVFSGSPTQAYLFGEMLAADFNGDRTPDVIIADAGLDTYENGVGVGPWLGATPRLALSSRGRLVAASAQLASLPSAFLHSEAVADIDGDGDLDVYQGSISSPQRPYLLINDGQGRFTYDQSRLPDSVTSASYGPFTPGPVGTLTGSSNTYTGSLFVDVDRDASPDLVLLSDDRTTNGIVLLNDGRGNFRVRAPIQLPQGTFGGAKQVQTTAGGKTTFSTTGPASVQLRAAVIDLNGDAYPDLVIEEAYNDSNNGVYYRGSHLQLLVNQGGTGFVDEWAARGAPGFTSTANFDSYIGETYVFDVNADGAPDIIALRTFGGSYEPHVYLNDGGGHFSRGSVTGLPAQGMLVPLESGTGKQRRIVNLQFPPAGLVSSPGGQVGTCRPTIQVYSAPR